MSTGNVAVWFMRLSLFFGKFDYARRGILDETHVHLYTLKSFKALAQDCGLKPVSVAGTAIPFELLFRGYGQSWWVKSITWVYAQFVSLWKAMFAFQFVIVAELPAGFGNAEVLEIKL